MDSIMSLASELWRRFLRSRLAAELPPAAGPSEIEGSKGRAAVDCAHQDSRLARLRAAYSNNAPGGSAYPLRFR